MPPTATIVTAPGAGPLETRAARELTRYIRTLFGFTPRAGTTDTKSAAVIALGTADSGVCRSSMPRLGHEDYVVRRVSPRRIEICGGSPVGVLWGAYELVERWGVTYLIQGDVLPEPGAAGRFALPKIDVLRRPRFAQRGSRVLGDMLNTNACASLREHEKLLDQLCKLRFNTVLGGATSSDPWMHWSFRGVERTRAGTVYGMRHMIHERSIGRDVIGRLGHYDNPDLRDADSYDEYVAAGKRLMHGILAAAHERGIRMIYAHITSDIPEELVVHLPRWSRRHKIPRSSLERREIITLGMQDDRTNYRYGHLMTPLNPAYVELVESSFAALIEEYPEMDAFLLCQCEWPPSAGGIERCWRDLDRRHGLAPDFTFDKLMKEAGRDTIIGSATRAVDQTKAGIITVRMLDLILNERRHISRILPAHTKIFTSFMGRVLAPVLPRIFDADRIEFEATLDYLASEAAKSVDSLKATADSGLKVHLGLAVNDDNVGFMPQYTTKVIDQSLRGMHRAGVSGYMCRLYETSKYEAIMAHLSAASWDGGVRPKQTYEALARKVCGPRAVEPMVEVYRLLEAALKDVDQAFGAGFMMPHLLSKYWIPVDVEREAGIRPQTLKKIMRRMIPIEAALEKALAASRPGGRRFVGDLLEFIRFVMDYLRVIELILEARRSYDAAHALRPKGRTRKEFDMTRYNELIREASTGLDEAVRFMESATCRWASCVRDAADRGSLVGLNVYGLDWLRGKAVEIGLERELWFIPLDGVGA